MEIKLIPLVVVIVYLLAMVGIGVCFTRRAGKSEADYYTAGKSIASFWGGMAIASDYTSAGMICGFLTVIIANPMFKIIPIKPEPMAGIIGAVVSAIALIIVTLATSDEAGSSQVKEAS